MKYRSSDLANTTSFIILYSLQLIFCILLQHCASYANNLFSSALAIVQVSLPFNITLRTYVLIKFFRMLISMLLEVNRFFFLLNAHFAWFILLAISFYSYHLPLLNFLDIRVPTCCNDSLLIVMLVDLSRSSSRLLHMRILVFWDIIIINIMLVCRVIDK